MGSAAIVPQRYWLFKAPPPPGAFPWAAGRIDFGG